MRGVVVACGEDAVGGAQAWAEVLGRKLCVVSEVEDLRSLTACGSLTIALGDHAREQLERIAALSTVAGLVVGVVAADPAAAQRHRRLAAEPFSDEVVAFTQLGEPPDLGLGTAACLLGPESIERMRQALDRRPRTVFLQTHGDGASSPVGDRVLCSRKGFEGTAPLRALPCFHGGCCLRGDGPWDDPDRFIGVHEIPADTLVFFSCFAVMPDDGYLDPAAALSGRFVRDGSVRAFLGPTRVIADDPRRFEAALRRYLAGASLGELALLLNRAPSIAGACWVLLGDPETSIRQT